MSLTALAKEILKHAQTLDAYIEENGLPEPSFDSSGPLDFPIVASTKTAKLLESRTALMELNKELSDLAAGPTHAVATAALIPQFECMALRAVNGFRIPEAVPITGSATFSEIAASTGVSEEIVTRIIRHATTMRIFSESDGNVSHNAASRALLENSLLRDYVTTALNTGFRVASNFQEAVAKYGTVDEPTQTAFNVAFGTDESFYQFIQRDEEKERMKALSGFMGFMVQQGDTGGRTHSPEHLLDAFDWAGIGNALVVDVGGSLGEVSALIAAQHNNLRFIVQDLAPIIALAEPHSQIAFEVHNFLTPQPPTSADADVFLLRHIMHDHSDKHAATILRNITLVMKPTAKILIVDFIPSADAPNVVRKAKGTGDMFMMALLAGKERERTDWERLLQNADTRLRIMKFTETAGSAFGVVEVGFANE